MPRFKMVNGVKVNLTLEEETIRDQEEAQAAIDKQAEIRFWGGDNMIKSGGYNVKHIKELAFMGFFEVLKNIRTIISNIRFCKNDIKDFNPDRIIYIDYPGFNLKICKWAKNNGYKNYS